MKKVFPKMFLLIIFSIMIVSCTAESDSLLNQNSQTLLDQNLKNATNRDPDGGSGLGPNVLMQESDSGGGSSSGDTGCNVSEFSTIVGNDVSGYVAGRIVPNFGAPAFGVPYYIDFKIDYSKNSQGNYVLVKNISVPKTNCSAYGQPTVTSNNCNAYYTGGHLVVATNFIVKYSFPKMDNSGGYDTFNIVYSKSNTFTLP